jgi:hypothetical protein
MLERVQAQVRDLRGLRVALHTDHAALVVEVVIGALPQKIALVVGGKP